MTQKILDMIEAEELNLADIQATIRRLEAQRDEVAAKINAAYRDLALTVKYRTQDQSAVNVGK